MKRILPALFSFFSIAATAQTNVGGVISGNVTWTAAGNPYTVTANTLVQFASTLTIMPGVQINFNQGLYLQVDGTIRVQGSAAAPVLFQAINGQTTWGGIRFPDIAMNYDSTTDTGNRISYAVITGMDNWTNPINIDSCWVRVHKTEIIGGQRGIEAHNSSSFLDSNLIHHNYGGGISCWDDATNVYSPYNTIRGNVIHDCQYGAGMAAMRGIMEGNHVYNVPDGAGIANDWLFTYPPVFINNVIENCSGVGLALSEMSEGGIYTGNVFRNNAVHIQIYCDPKCEVRCNRFMNQTGQYKIYGVPTTWSSTCPAPGSGSYYTIDLTSNNWDGMTPAGLDSATHDFNDNFAVGLFMLYSPMLSDTDSCLSPIPPPIPPPPQSIEEDWSAIQLGVFPNPSSNILNLTISDADYSDILVEVFASNGALIHTSSRSNVYGTFSEIVDMSNQSSGIYLVRITADGMTADRRVIKAE